MDEKDNENIRKHLLKEGITEKEITNLINNYLDKDDITFIAFEQYNFPDLFCRVYRKDVCYPQDYLGVIEDYFDDCDDTWEEILVYDVKKHKFVYVNKSVSAITRG